MKNLKKLTMIHQPPLLACAVASMFFAISASGQTLVQTFETGEDTSNWGANWVAPNGFTETSPSFLNASIGGSQTGFGSTSFGQEASRVFRNNTVGIDVSAEDYSVSLYMQLALNGSDPASGDLYVLDGSFGDYTANIRLSYDAAGTLTGLAAADGSGWATLNVTLDKTSPYRFQFTVDPTAKTYSATVSEVDANGAVLSSATLNDLAITGNAINNHQNGQLEIHADASAGTVDFKVDNISIQAAAVPEPASVAIFGFGAAALFIALKRRHPRSSSNSPPAR